MKATLSNLFQHNVLDEKQAYDALMEISKGNCSDAHIASFLTVYQMRAISVQELSGFRNALLDLCIEIDLKEFDPIDLCGTGGDGKDTFNISTLSAIVAAGAGVKVAKHGNYGVSSACGSSNVMEHLGYQFTNDIPTLKTQIDKHNLCFLHAPLFHPAMKHAGPVRKALGFKTFFNMLGPIVNPAKVKKQSTGVFSLQLARLYNYIFQNETNHKYNIVFALDGYDEISLTGGFKIITQHKEELLQPENIGFAQHTQQSLFGGSTVAAAAKIFTDILEGNGTQAQNEVVLANAGFAINCASDFNDVKLAINLAKESLISGKALEVLKNLTA